MKYLVLFTFYASLLSCSSFNNKPSDECLEKRAAFDIGSGSTKMTVAEVNHCTNNFKLLYETHRPLKFKESLKKTGRIEEEIILKAIQTLKELKKVAISYQAHHYSAVATSAFRKALNGRESLSRISRSVKIKMITINPDIEMKLGLLAAYSQLKNQEKQQIAVWDIGGGSMQIMAKKKNGYETYHGQLASVGFKDLVLSMKTKKSKTPNPIGRTLAKKSITRAKTFAEKEINTHLSKLLEKATIIGIGGVHYHSLARQMNSKGRPYDQKTLYQTLMKRSTLNDKELGGAYAATDVTNLALVLGFMKAVNIKKVLPLNVHLAHGLLLDEKSW